MNSTISWAPRVPMEDIFRLYERFACGALDDNLTDDIAYAIYARCESIVEATNAEQGHVLCRSCRNTVIERKTDSKEELVSCEKCGWQITWGEYFTSYHRKQLSGGCAIEAFRGYLERMPACRSTDEKMSLIDWAIHQCHLSIRPEKNIYSARPAAINLIDGNMHQLIPFLNTLPEAPNANSKAEFAKWKEHMVKAMNLSE